MSRTWKSVLSSLGIFLALGTFTYSSGDGVTVLQILIQNWNRVFRRGLHGPGTYCGGSAIHTLVGNIDNDPKLEIIVTGLATGPLYAWHSDGSPQSCRMAKRKLFGSSLSCYGKPFQWFARLRGIFGLLRRNNGCFFWIRERAFWMATEQC